eukprot:Rhum_TRINITY_DN14342_c16_g1::Rhum_TRINITY_DN14342_c16_g1_i1::g.81236::m.81236
MREAHGHTPRLCRPRITLGRYLVAPFVLRLVLACFFHLLLSRRRQQVNRIGVKHVSRLVVVQASCAKTNLAVRVPPLQVAEEQLRHLSCGDALPPVNRSRHLRGNGTRGVRVAQQVHRLDDALLKGLRLVEPPQRHGQAVHAVRPPVRRDHGVAVVPAVVRGAAALDRLRNLQTIGAPVPVHLVRRRRLAQQDGVHLLEARVGGRRCLRLRHEVGHNLVQEDPHGRTVLADGLAALVCLEGLDHQVRHELAAGHGVRPRVRPPRLLLRHLHRTRHVVVEADGHGCQAHDRPVARVLVLRPEHRRHLVSRPALLRQPVDLHDRHRDVAAEPDGAAGARDEHLRRVLLVGDQARRDEAERVAVALVPPQVPPDARVAAVVRLVCEERVGEAQGH